MNNLKSCNSCKHNHNEMCAKTISTKYHQPTDSYFQDWQTCKDARLGKCGIAGVYHESVKATLDDVSVIFDGFSETQPKSKIETRESF